jgi:hypothetical protein
MKSISLRTSVAGFALAFGASMATPTLGHASPLYTFTNSGISGGGGETSYGTVTVTQSGTSLLFDVESSPNSFLNTGAHHTFTFNLSTTTGIIANIVTDGALSFSQVSGTSFGDPPFGNFDYAIDCSGTKGNSNCGNSLKFTVLNAGSLLPSTGDSTIFFAADISSSANGNTGVVGATLTTTPLPGAVAMFGPVLGAGYFLTRQRKRRAADSAAVAAA